MVCLLLVAAPASYLDDYVDSHQVVVKMTAYSVDVECGTGGTFTVNGQTVTGTQTFFVQDGDALVITVTPRSGYRLNTPVYSGMNSVVESGYTFTLYPGADGSVSFTFRRVSSDEDSSGGSTGSGAGSGSSGGGSGGSTVDPNAQDAENLNTLGVDDLPFTDVPTDAYYYNAVAWAVEAGVTTGTTATTFSPDDPCTRAQIVTFLYRNAGSPEPTSTYNPFTDVKKSDYYYKAVLWGVENGVVKGLTPTTFGGEQLVTRAQAVTFQWRAANSPSASGRTFRDVDYSEYYGTAVQWAVQNDITTGTTSTTFSPEDPCTRAQIVTFLYRQVLLEGGE
jgi:hypothetical protein